MIGYKVVFDNEGEYWSLSVLFWNMVGIKYMIGKKVYAFVGDLFVFDNLKNVKNFVKDFKEGLDKEWADKIKIFKCEFKKSRNDFLNDFSIFPLPEGTIRAEWLKLIEEV